MENACVPHHEQMLMLIKKRNLIMQKGCCVIQLKFSDFLKILKMRGINKVVLAVELSIYFFTKIPQGQTVG